MNQVDHTALMAQQDPDFPDYDERGWPGPLVCAVDELRQHAAYVREVGEALRSTNALRGDRLLQIASSLEIAAERPERYMAETAGPGLPTFCFQREEGKGAEPGVLMREAAERLKEVGDWEHRGYSVEDAWNGKGGEPYRALIGKLRAAACEDSDA